MPKIYSEKERLVIIEKLKNEANILMQEKGVKKTTVDELVKRAGIPKGTFYLFYPSKEMLLFDCSQDLHKEVDEFILKGMNKIIKKHNIDTSKDDAFSEYTNEITDVILGSINITQNSCLKVLLDPESMNLILSKLPKDVLKKHIKEEASKDKTLFESFALKKGMKTEEIKGAFTMILFGSMYKQVIGEKNINPSTKYLVRGLVNQIFG